MPEPASTATRSQQNGELGWRDDRETELVGRASTEHGVHGIEVGDPLPPPPDPVERAIDVGYPYSSVKAATAGLDAGWVASVKDRVQRLSAPGGVPPPPTIFRVPKIFRDVSPSAYEPKIISFGPFHHGRDHLRVMEEQKWRYLSSLLRRGNGVPSVEDYLTKMKELEVRVRSCYAEATHEVESNQFVEMMMLDGCFLVELILKYSSLDQQPAPDVVGVQEGDPVFGSTWGSSLLIGDMLMLENQIPFFVLQHIWSLYWTAHCYNHLLVWSFLHLLKELSPTHSRVPESADSVPAHLNDPHHLLHLFHSYILPNPRDSQRGETGETMAEHWAARCLIPTATYLKDAGVKFLAKSGPNVVEVSFADGVMHMSPLCLYDHTERVFRNLMAFEQCFPSAGNGVTTYAVLMDSLVDTPTDVALLKRRGVLINRLGSDEEAAHFLNNLGKELAFSYEGEKISKDVTKFCQQKWPKWRAQLMDRYCRNPWMVISVLAATLLLLLTVAQTLVTAFSYWKPRASS